MSKASSQKGYKAGQCGKFVNDYLQSIGVTGASNRYYDNDLSTKLNSVNSHDVKAGTVAVFDYWYKGSDGINHGHVGIVTKVYADGSFDIMDSNRYSDEKVDIRHVTEGDKDRNALQGFFDPSKAPANWWSKTTLSDVDEAKKQNYLEEARRGRLWVNDTKAIWDIAAEQGWADEWQEAFKWWQNWDYTETQVKRMDKADDTFYSNIDVKDFDSAKNQFRNLVASLNDASWVWDMSAIFTFMKTLDPSSVVREGEFQAAANTIWDANRDAILQKLEKHVNWETLTAKQREDFKKVAKEFIKIKAEAYQNQYDFLTRRYQGAGLDLEDLPVNNAKILLDMLDGMDAADTTSSWSNGVSSIWYPSWYSNVPTVYTNGNATTNVGWHNLPTQFY